MSDVRNALADYLARLGISYKQGSQPSILLAGFELQCGDVMLVFDCRDDVSQLLIRVLYPFHAPAQHLAKVAEFITRVNYELSLGCFEMDYADGTLGFRIGIDVDGASLTSALVRNLIEPSLAAADHFYPALAAVALCGAVPLEALQMDATASHPEQR